MNKLVKRGFIMRWNPEEFFEMEVFLYPKNVEFSLQDDKKTLKIFVNKPEKETWSNFTNMETSS
jgi:hypothetical protein